MCNWSRAPWGSREPAPGVGVCELGPHLVDPSPPAPEEAPGAADTWRGHDAPGGDGVEWAQPGGRRAWGSTRHPSTPPPWCWVCHSQASLPTRPKPRAVSQSEGGYLLRGSCLWGTGGSPRGIPVPHPLRLHLRSSLLVRDHPRGLLWLCPARSWGPPHPPRPLSLWPLSEQLEDEDGCPGPSQATRPSHTQLRWEVARPRGLLLHPLAGQAPRPAV